MFVDKVFRHGVRRSRVKQALCKRGGLFGLFRGAFGVLSFVFGASFIGGGLFFRRLVFLFIDGKNGALCVKRETAVTADKGAFVFRIADIIPCKPLICLLVGSAVIQGIAFKLVVVRLKTGVFQDVQKCGNGVTV